MEEIWGAPAGWCSFIYLFFSVAVMTDKYLMMKSTSANGNVGDAKTGASDGWPSKRPRIDLSTLKLNLLSLNDRIPFLFLFHKFWRNLRINESILGFNSLSNKLHPHSIIYAFRDP